MVFIIYCHNLNYVSTLCLHLKMIQLLEQKKMSLQNNVPNKQCNCRYTSIRQPAYQLVYKAKLRETW